MSDVALSIVIPMFNEEFVLQRSLTSLHEVCDAARTELILVDDGSTDRTNAVATKALSNWPLGTVLTLARNRGKGAAVRHGFAASRGHAVAFCDADMSTDLAFLPTALAALESHDIVIASRGIDGAEVHRSTPIRTVMGRTFNRLMRAAMELDIADSQCGFKAFRGNVGRRLLALTRCDGFAFDAEVLRLASMLGYSVDEQPVRWIAGEQSSVRPLRDSFGTAVELFRIRIATRPSGLTQRLEAEYPHEGLDTAAGLGTNIS